MRRVLFSWAALLAMLIAAPVMAQPPATTPAEPPPTTMPLEVERWIVTPFIGAGFSGDLQNSPLNLGAAVGYNVTSRVTVEGQFGYMGAEQGDVFRFDSNVWTLDANVLYHFTEQYADRQWATYVALGLGMIRATADLEGAPILEDLDDSTTKLAVNFGGGVKTALTERVQLRGDLRYYTGDDIAPSFWRATAGLGFLLSR
ncbi:MAG TPA: outer membrane beta-barrel protein [Vicinamibacterales bacterium]|nr:outer membrane beta-barrel protein [Vicinamibacterales bacterium]